MWNQQYLNHLNVNKMITILKIIGSIVFVLFNIIAIITITIAAVKLIKRKDYVEAMVWSILVIAAQTLLFFTLMIIIKPF